MTRSHPSPAARRGAPDRRAGAAVSPAPPLRVLATVTFNENQLAAHLLPFVSLGDVAEVILVTDTPVRTPPRVRTVVPSRIMSRVTGRAAAKLITCVVVGVRERPDWTVGYNLVPHGLTALAAGRIAGAQVMYHQIGGPREWLGGGWDSDNAVLGHLRRPSRLIERALLAAIRNMDVVVAMGPRGRDVLLQHGVRPERTAVIPAATLAGKTLPSQRVAPDFDVIAVGELIGVKRVQDILQATAKLRADGLQVRVAVVGTGPLAPVLERTVEELSLGDSVSFLGFRHDVADLYRRSLIYVSASQYEGLSIALLDAMAAGLPPVVSDVGEVGDVVSQGQTGLLFSAGDVPALAEAIRRLLSDEGLRRRLGDAARAQALQVAGLDSVSSRLRSALGAEGAHGNGAPRGARAATAEPVVPEAPA